MSSHKPGNTGIKRIVKAVGYSLQGLRAAFEHEAAFRQEVMLAAVFIPLGIIVGDHAAERAVLVGVSMLVLIVEIINSAIEALVDRISTEHHELSGRAKDLGSAAVMLSLALWAYAWIDITLN